MNINWTTIDMVKKADDFYSSMGLPKMVKKFWKNSYFEKNEKLQKCHGTAANMYNDKDFRFSKLILKAYFSNYNYII